MIHSTREIETFEIFGQIRLSERYTYLRPPTGHQILRSVPPPQKKKQKTNLPPDSELRLGFGLGLG